MLEIKTFETPGASISYAEGPASGPPLVLLHGILSSWRTFIPCIPMLLPRWHIYALDFRGHGASAHVSDDYTLGRYSEDVVAFLEDRVQESVCVYGHSLGGMVGILTAARQPRLIRGLVVGDSLLYRESIAASVPEGRDSQWQKKKELLERRLSVAELTQEYVRTMPGRGNSLNRLAAVVNAQADPAVLDNLSANLLQDYDCARLLPAIECPVLLLQAQLMSRTDAERAVADLREGYATSFENMGHGLHLESNGVEVTLAVQGFLESLL